MPKVFTSEQTLVRSVDPVPNTFYLLMETGDYLLQENDDRIVLE